MGGRRTPRPTRRPVAMALALLLLVSFASLVQPVEGKMTAIKRTSSGGPLRRSTRNVGGQPRAPDGDGPAVSKRTYRGSFQLDGVPWQRHRDPKSGKEYYFNVATKESAWDDPRRAARETEEARRGGPSGAGPSGAGPSGAGPSGAGPSGDTPRVVKRPGDAPRHPKSAVDSRHPAEKWYGSGDQTSRRPMDAREAFQRKAEARERVRAAKKLEAARRAAGAPPAPKRHGGPFFVSGVVAVFTFSVLSSVVAWLVRSVRAVRSMRGPGGTQAAGGGVDGSDPLAVELRALAGTQLAKWFKRTKERLRRKMRQLAELVADVKSSRSGSDAFAKISCAITNAERAPELAALGRFLIATYYFNLCADKYGEYAWRWRYREYAERYGLTNASDEFSGDTAVTPVGFPWIAAFVVTCTTMMCHGVYPVRCSAFMLAYDVMDNVGLFFDVFVSRRSELNELAMKKIALFGCTCLLVAHFGWRGGVKRGDERYDERYDPFAALATDDDPFDAVEGNPRRRDGLNFGARKSAILLAARCAMAALFFFVGLAQIKRIVARDFALFARRSSDDVLRGAYRDGHDNNWLLLEFALAAPLAAGWGGHVVTRALTLTLFAEAFGCWRFWAPRTFRPDHARAHFVTNLACGGGLILLQAFGSGRYTVDNYVHKHKKKT